MNRSQESISGELRLISSVIPHRRDDKYRYSRKQKVVKLGIANCLPLMG